MANQAQAIQLQISVKPAQLLIGTAAVIGLLFAMVTLSTSSIVRAQNEATVNQQNTQQPQVVYGCNDQQSNGVSSNDSDKTGTSLAGRSATATSPQSNSSVITQTVSNDVTNITRINRYNYKDSFNKNNNNGNALGSFNGNALGSFNKNKMNSDNTDIDIRNNGNNSNNKDESVTIKDSIVGNSYTDQSTNVLDLSNNLDITIKDSTYTENNNNGVIFN